MTPAERIAAIEKECSGVYGASGITSWERARMAEWKHLDRLTDKQDAIIKQIEKKAFGEDDE